MRIVLVFRSYRPGGYSIEELFQTIGAELSKQEKVITYRVGSRWRLLLDSWRMRLLNGDIYHITGDVHYLCMFLPRAKVVLTIHDINHYLYDLSGVKKLFYKWLWLILPLRTANIVTAISEDTRRSLATHFKMLPERIPVVRNCVAPRFRFCAKHFNAQTPSILQIGTQPHKNVQRLAEALRGITCKLVIVGKLDAALAQKLLDHRIEHINFVNLSNEQLVEKYEQADLVTFVSLAEGFGLPIIEANAVGRPVVTSNISPMSDVAGDAACVVSPKDVAEIRNGILRIIRDPEYRETLVSNGLRNAERYLPEAVAKEYLRVYSRIVKPSVKHDDPSL